MIQPLQYKNSAAKKNGVLDWLFSVNNLLVYVKGLFKKGSKFNTQSVHFHQKERNGSGYVTIKHICK